MCSFFVRYACVIVGGGGDAQLVTVCGLELVLGLTELPNFNPGTAFLQTKDF